MNKIKIYCVTNKLVNFIKKDNYKFGWVGKDIIAEKKYLKCDYGDNIFYKEQYYSELTFHYWYWKNLLKIEDSQQWVGFCQKRRYWIKNQTQDKINVDNINEYLLTDIDNDTRDYEALICNPIEVSTKKMKLIKRGWRNILSKPSIFFNPSLINLSDHFDIHHGFGHLEKAVNLLNVNDRNDFKEYLKVNKKFNPHIMFIAKKKIINNWFNALFPWLEKCEKIFGFEKLSGYDTRRLYAYLSERYLSFWFKKYTKFKTHPWVFLDF